MEMTTTRPEGSTTMTVLDLALTETEAATIARNLGRKFTDADITPALVDFATRWVATYDGDFPFLVDMAYSARRGTLSVGKARGVLNCFRTRLPEPTPAPGEPVADGLDLSALPAGRYAVPGGDTRLKVRIDKPDEGRWAGWIFVKDAAEYGYGKRYGKAAPGQPYRGEIQAELAAILADPAGAAAAYGHLTSRCGICNRPLEDPDSVARGIGPVCATKF